MADREVFSGPDNAWRRMGVWNNLMSITGFMSFDQRLTYEELCTRLEERLMRFDRFKQRVGGRERTFRRPFWVTIDDFDVRSHVYQMSLPDPGDKATFQRFVGQLMSRPLDERQPLWEMYLLDDAGAGAGNAVAFRLNHSIGDGFALLYVLFGLIDDPETVEFPMGAVSAAPSEDGGDEATATAAPDGGGAGGEAAGSGGGPLAALRDAADVARTVAGGAGTAARATKVGYDLLTAEDEPMTPLMGRLGTAKRAAWSDRFDLAAVKSVGRENDATINDVLLAATAGALGTHLRERGHDPDELVLRCTMPVNLRPMERRDGELGNHFGLAFVPLPVGEPDFEKRVRFVRDRTDPKRLGIEAYLIYLALYSAGRLPRVVQDRMLELFERQATGIVTNVPGPKHPIHLAGKQITDLVFWVPQANDQGLGISIFTYDGGVRVSVAGDANLVPDPGAITAAVESELDAIGAEAGHVVGEAEAEAEPGTDD